MLGALLILIVAVAAFLMLLIVVLVAIGVPIQWMGARRAGVPGWGPGSAGSVRQITVHGSTFVAFEKAADALAAIPNVNITEVDRDRLLINVRRGPSWRSFGERAHVQFQVLNAADVTISAESHCARFHQVFDYGRNASNVQLFLTTISQALAEAPR
jgi:hypothetical protein